MKAVGGKGNLGPALQDWARDLQSLAGNFTFLAVNLELRGILGFLLLELPKVLLGVGEGRRAWGFLGILEWVGMKGIPSLRSHPGTLPAIPGFLNPFLAQVS